MSLPLHTFLHFGILSFVPEAAGVLATLTHPNHSPSCAHQDSFTCRLPATSVTLDITVPSAFINQG
ncbi:hypothetical protein A6J66_014485 [Yersinia enterocolitica]|nr:hypothetical protein A6J66_014485 [Yersinia enterocolitica]